MVFPQRLQLSKPVEVQLRFLIEKYNKYLTDKTLMKKIFSSKAEMSKQCYKIVLTYIRKIRAFLFKQPSDEVLNTENAGPTLNTKTPTPRDIPLLLDEILSLFE